MKKRILALFLTAVLTFSLSSCNQTENVPSEVTANETTTVTEIESIPVPEGGWTRESLNDVIYINGVNYEFPLTLEKLGEDYECDEIAYFNDYAATNMSFKNNLFFTLGFIGDEEISVDNDTIINEIMVASSVFDVNEKENYANKALNINGVSLGSNHNEILEKLGNPNIVESFDGNIDINPNQTQLYKYYINQQLAISIYYNGDEKNVRKINLYWEEN